MRGGCKCGGKVIGFLLSFLSFIMLRFIYLFVRYHATSLIFFSVVFGHLGV